MKLDKGLVSGSTTLLILNLLQNEDMYGYQMIENLERRSNNVFTLKAGTLYPLLHALEQQSIIKSYDVEESNRTRKYYSLTDIGNKVLDKKKAEWVTYTKAVNDVLGGLQYATV
ncbi:MAG TPA: PadR family transcriptional regulator [Clostridia bacterium]|nr:PadR family transcriptional regulator [Clostridia bacterium]